MVEVHGEVAAHVLRGGHEVAGGLDAGPEGRAVGGAQAEPVAVPGRQSVAFRGVESDVAVAHAQRREDVALDVLRIGLAGRPLDDQPGQDVVGVGVLERRPGWRGERRAVQLAQCFKSGTVGRAPDDRAARGRRQPGGLLKHLAHRDAIGGPLVGKLELRHVLTGGRVKVEPAGVDELHRRQRREGLRGRTEQKRRLRRGGAVLTGIAEAARVHHLVPGYHGHGEARHARPLHTVADDAVHPRERRAIGRKRRPQTTAVTATRSSEATAADHPAHSAAGTRLGHESPGAGFGLTAPASAESGAVSWPPMSRRKGGYVSVIRKA